MLLEQKIFLYADLKVASIEKIETIKLLKF